MAQAESWWQYKVNQLWESSVPEFKSRAFKSLSKQYLGTLGFWLFGFSVAIAMLYWNWKLLIATSVGVLVMWLVYRLQTWDWQLYWSNLRRFFGGANRQLTLAVGSGGLATLSAYMAVSIGVDTDSVWVAAGAMLQGFGTLAILVLLVWQIFGRQALREEARVERILGTLTDPDPLKRLIAVRHLTSLATKYDKANKYGLAEYFRLMLDREQELPVREAVLEALQAFDKVKVQKLPGGDAPLEMPVNLKRSVAKSRRRIAENF